MTPELRELYEEVILDHNRNPRNFDKHPEGANRRGYGFNPICQDEITLHLKVNNGVVEDVGIEGVGCAISTASASLMSVAVKGKTEQEVNELFEAVRDLLTNDEPKSESEQRAGKLQILAGVRKYPMRVKCATLAWHTLRAALNGIESTVNTEEPEEVIECKA